MAQTVEELAELLENMQTEADKNAEALTKILTGINTQLENIQNDTETDDLIKVYLNEYKKALEDRHAFVKNEFVKVGNAFNILAKRQEDLSTSAELDNLQSTLSNTLQIIQDEVYNQRDLFNKLSTTFTDYTNDKRDKEEILSTINAIKQENEITNSNFESNITSIINNTESILKNLVVMDPTAQNDIVKRELENIYIATTSILTSIHETEQKSDILLTSIQQLASKEQIGGLHDEIIRTFTDSNNRISDLINTIGQKIDDIALASNDSKILYEFDNIKRLIEEQRKEFSDNSDIEKLSAIEIQLTNAVNTISSIKNEDLQRNQDSITQLITQTFDILSNKIEAVDTKAVSEAVSHLQRATANIEDEIETLAHQSDIADLYTSIKEFSNILDTLKNNLITSDENFNSLVEKKFDDFGNKIREIVTETDFTNFKHELADFIQQIIDNSTALNQNLSIQKDVLENLINKIDNFEFSQNFESLSSLLSQIKENAATNKDTIISEINSLPEKINESINSKTAYIEDKLTQSANDIKVLQNDILLKLTDNTDTEKFQGIHNNIDMLRDTITSSQNSRESELNERITGITGIINEGLQTRNEKFENLQASINSFKTDIDNFISNFETNSGNNLATITEIKSKIEDVAHVFTDWNFGQETRDSKIISMISSEIENLANTVNELQTSVQTQVHNELSGNAEILSQQTDKLTAYIEELKAQIENTNKDEKFDAIKNRIDNSSALINDNINLLKDTITSTLNDNALSEKLLAIRNIIVEKSDLNDENLRDLQEKIEEFISVGNRISSEAEIKMGNSVSELADLKTEIEDISSSFRNWDYNREEHDTKMVGMISAELDSLKESVSTFQEGVQSGIHQELTRNSENIERQLNNIIGYVENLKNELNENAANKENEEISTGVLQDISDKINVVRQEINLINTDIMDTVNTSAKALMAEVSPLKDSLDAIVEIKDKIKAEYEALNDTSRNENLFNAIEDIKNFINEKLQISQQNNDELKNIVNVAMNKDELKWSIDEFKNTVGARISESNNSINEMLDTINQKIDIIASSEDVEIQYDLEEIKNMISSQRELLENAGSDKLSSIEEKLKDLLANINGVDPSNTNDIRESIIEAIINVFDQISFIEESEDIKDFVEEKTDEINQNIIEVKKQLTQFVNGEDDYSYTLQDVESDIAKLRMVLNDLSNTSSQEEISDISDNIHRIVKTVEELQTSLTQEQVSELKTNFEKLSEDVLSISSRTNKLLLTSDESYNALNNGLNDFSNVISQLEERINYLDNKEITERIEAKLDNTYNVVTNSANSDKVMRQALMYMGEWIDTTSENIESLCENTDVQNGKSEEIISALEEIKETLPEQKQLLNTITVHFDEQQERMDRLEMKLEKILTAIDNIDDTKLVNKVDKIDKQVKKLITTMEKLATYVDE